MKILIIRFSSIGDIVLTSPVVRCIKKQIPSSQIHYLTKASFSQIVGHNPFIDVKHYLRDNWNGLITTLKKEKFDLIIDLHHNLRSLRIKASLRRRTRCVNKINFEKWVYVYLRCNIMPAVHIVDRYLETVRDLGIRNDHEGLNYFIPPGDEVRAQDLPLSHLHGYVAISIGGNHNTKKLPEAKLQNLIKELHYPVILLGGSEDRGTGEELRKTDTLKIFNGCGIFSLNQSASLVRQSKLVITHDTGLMHIAAAFKKKIISVWGNTVPEFGMYPYYGTSEMKSPDYKNLSRIVQVEGLPCRPCSKLGYEKCPKNHFKCMNSIDTSGIAEMAGAF